MDVMPRVIAVIAIAFADFLEQRRQTIHIAAQNLAHHEHLLLMRQILEARGYARKFRVEIGERFLAGGVGVQTAERVEEVVASGSFDRPIAAQLLSRLKN